MDDSPAMKLATEWIANFNSPDFDIKFDEICFNDPHLVYAAILKIIQQPISDEMKSILAAGPLETILVRHGITLINCVEEEAKNNSSFNLLLGGVWQNLINEDVWKRICAVRRSVW